MTALSLGAKIAGCSPRLIILREFQKQALEILTKPKHLLCVSPTGSGKSLIFETVVKKNFTRTLMISPLVALALQQVQRFNEIGVPVATSQQPPPNLGVWILNPESLEHPSVLRKAINWRPNFLVVDECHCLWEWGRDFRPAFLKIPRMIELCGIKKSLWLTATMTPEARRFLLSALQVPLIEIGGFHLPHNLALGTEKVSVVRRMDRVIEFLQDSKKLEGSPESSSPKISHDSGILFVRTRDWAEKLSRWLDHHHISNVYYHAGRSKEEKVLLELHIRQQRPRVVVATSAFGMGIHIRHLRWALFYHPPFTLMSLTQGLGRVGRDQTCQALGLVFWEDEDFKMLEKFAPLENALKKKFFIELQKVHLFLKSDECRISHLERTFKAHQTSADCMRCDHCFGLQGKKFMV